MFDTQITDEYLIERIGNNDYNSYNSLFDRYYVRLCQYVYGLLMDKDDTEDVVQELFLSLWKNRSKIEIRENASAYLYKMAKYFALNQIRTKSRYTTFPENQEQYHLYYEENQLEADEFRIALYDCIDRLPERSREVLLLHRIKGLKQKEISEKLTISVKTIKNQIWISLQKLRKCLELKGM
ncbi:RNA polymerase sigma-70 factor [uncultured Parabacteroides sp.]|uniref:RNA polymerase sigma factor n=1 Tax=uncultured Parabacteroides sp. TaxID=512312 RepID=UPI00258D4732|nr:RNA polymerase sigma-70 factor [uncultured Parabacteroides sp.]